MKWENERLKLCHQYPWETRCRLAWWPRRSRPRLWLRHSRLKSFLSDIEQTDFSRQCCFTYHFLGLFAKTGSLNLKLMTSKIGVLLRNLDRDKVRLMMNCGTERLALFIQCRHAIKIFSFNDIATSVFEKKKEKKKSKMSKSQLP